MQLRDFFAPGSINLALQGSTRDDVLRELVGMLGVSDVSAETLACTTGLDGSGAVNLEKALRLSDRLGGHLVSGHVDGVGVVVRFEAVGDPAGSWRLDVDAPRGLARFIAPKGSIAVDGASLTINEVNGQRFSANLIPHTLAMTTLGVLAAGSRVNLEVDLIARYVDRLVSSRL